MNSEVVAFSAPRTPTGIAGLDEILFGGLVANRFYLVQGEPGTGKTTLALQFLIAGRDAGEVGLYISLSETRAEIQGVAQSHGWNLNNITLVDVAYDASELALDAQNTLFEHDEVELTETTAHILAEIERVNPARVVFDSLSEWRLMSSDGLRFRRQILALKNHLAQRGATVILLDHKGGGDQSKVSEDSLQSMAHGVISLEQVLPEYGGERRRLYVVKMRGSRFQSGFHDYNIRTGGLEVFPRLVAANHAAKATLQVVKSGLDELDTLLGGGLNCGTATLILGAAGTGKSILSQQFLSAALARGERAALFAFEESLELILERSRRLGLGFEDALEKGALSLQTIDPAELSPGEFAHMAREAIETQNAGIVCIDSLNGYLYSMPEERHLILHMHELLSYLNARGVATLLIAAQGGMIGSHMTNPVDLSYLADAVILLRHFEAFGEVKQAISVLKKRSGRHERAIREYNLTDDGPRVGQPLREFRGVLTGTPLFQGNADDLRPTNGAN